MRTRTSSFTAEDADILGANEDYHALEQELQSRIDQIEKVVEAENLQICNMVRSIHLSPEALAEMLHSAQIPMKLPKKEDENHEA